MLRQFSTRRIIVSVCVDFVCTLGFLLLAAYWRAAIGSLPIRFVEALQRLHIPIQNWEAYSPSYTVDPAVFVPVAVIWPFFFVVFSVYDGRHSPTLRAELRNVFTAIVASTLTLAGVLYFTYQETSRVLFVLFFLLDIVFLLGFRVIWWFYRTRIVKQSHGQAHKILIIGAGVVGRTAAQNLARYAEGRHSIVGFVDDDFEKQGLRIDGYPVLGTLAQVATVVHQYGVHEAVVALPLRAHERLVEICRRLQNLSVRVHVIPDLFVLSFPGASLDGFGGIPVIDLGQPGIYGWQRWLKRFFDVLITTAVILVIWPLLLLLALLVRLDSEGPIFYRQRRIGENSVPFYMLKFRSMRVDADERIHREHVVRLISENISVAENGDDQDSLKLRNDPRVTRVGRFIRKTSLDELPQLFNVLRGEMSLVGPRPPIPYEVDLYQDWHKRRLEAIPGVTGLWQVRGRNRVSFDEMVRMDLEYIEHQSIWLDLKLLIQTPFVLLRGAG